MVTIAVLKSVQINQTLNFLYNQAFGITTRSALQQGFIDYYSSNEHTESAFAGVYGHLFAFIRTQDQILAVRVYTNDFTLLSNLTVSNVPYDFPPSLIPTAIPPVLKDVNSISGEILGPVAVPATPGSYALSITMRIINTNASTTPLHLGYISVIFTASGLLRTVNDTVGMGLTGQLLVIATNGSHYNTILPPVRTPQVYSQVVLQDEYPAVEMAFKNNTGYIINTRNGVGASVSVGYTV